MTDTMSLQKTTGSLKGCIIALAGFLLILFLPVADSLSSEGHRLMALTVACLILWVTEALPIPVTSILAIGGQALVGSATLRQASSNFISPVFFAYRFQTWIRATAQSDYPIWFLSLPLRRQTWLGQRKILD